MSKVRQAVRYERRAAKAQDRAHRSLSVAEHKAQKELFQQAIGYERKYTDGQFGQLNIVAQEHRLFHEREHLLYEDAIEKASASLSSALAAIQTDVDRFRDEATKWLTIDRFEREHQGLSEKMELAISTLGAKIGAEEQVTLRQATKDEVVTNIQANTQTTRRWMVGIAISIIGLFITVTIFGITTFLHVMDVI